MPHDVRGFTSFCDALLADGLSLGCGDAKGIHSIIPDLYHPGAVA